MSTLDAPGKPAADLSGSNSSETILRDQLALERTRLANERTLLAYVRTSFMLIVSGATALKVFADTPGVVITAVLFIVLGAFAGLFGAWRFVSVRRQINFGARPSLCDGARGSAR
jgi:inner membrane protein YidH